MNHKEVWDELVSLRARSAGACEPGKGEMDMVWGVTSQLSLIWSLLPAELQYDSRSDFGCQQ